MTSPLLAQLDTGLKREIKWLSEPSGSFALAPERSESAVSVLKMPQEAFVAERGPVRTISPGALDATGRFIMSKCLEIDALCCDC